MENGWRVAVASTDGETVNEHFGRAQYFCIFDIGRDGVAALKEKRSVSVYADASGHSDQAISDKLAALGDCAALLVMQIGPGAKRLLALSKIAVFEEAGEIKTALSKLAKYFIKTNFDPRPGK